MAELERLLDRAEAKYWIAGLRQMGALISKLRNLVSEPRKLFPRLCTLLFLRI